MSEVDLAGTHTCPHPTCQVRIPNRLFACRPHWFALPMPVRAAIYRTAGLFPTRPERAAAIRSATDAWRNAT